MKQYNFKTLFATFFFTLLMMAAWNANGQSERKQAKEFIQHSRPDQILFLLPGHIYKFNHKTHLSDSLRYHSQQEKEDLLWQHSKFIRYINDSVFLLRMAAGYSNELKAFGISVFTDQQAEQFFARQGKAYVVNVAQAELDEEYYPFTDTAFVDNDTYVFSKNLNALDVSVWFEISKVNAVQKDTTGHKVLFAENLLTDQVDGGFSFNDFNGKLQYLYRLDSLTLKKIYANAESLGRTYADYTFDYFMNQYINKHMPAGFRSNRYWRYDPYHHRLFLGKTDRLVPLK